MSLLFSTKDGFESLRFMGLLKGLCMAWLLPTALAAFAMLPQKLAGTPHWGDGFLMLWATSWLVLISPVISWLGLILAAPFVAVLMDRGWFGWIPALILGLLCGGVVAWLIGHVLAISFGAALMIALRAILGWLCPQAFTVLFNQR